MKVRLHIENRNQSEIVEIDNELTIGRTPAAQLVLDDEGLSRVNTTIFIEGDEVLVTDENSTNGTFLNGERISGPPKILRSGDHLKIGSHTSVRVEIEGSIGASPAAPAYEPAREAVPAVPGVPLPAAAAPAPAPPSGEPPYILIAAVGMALLIIVFSGVAYYIVSNGDDEPDRPKPVASDERIPVRVVDPLGNEDPDSLDDLVASWETAEEELDTSTVADVTAMATNADEADLNVSRSTFEEAKRRSFELKPGQSAGGIRNPSLNVPVELSIGFRNQTRKLQEMKQRGYEQPMDFADLARKRLSGDLIEMPMAAQSFYLEVGGSAQDIPFTSFRFSTPKNEVFPIEPGHVKFDPLKRLSENFSGQRFDLANPADRREMRRRLLRMFQRRAKPILQKLAATHFDKFGRPLRVTSLTRSMDYQILLTQGNANAFRVSGEGSLPPHTSGCAFDLARKHMPVEEQNFLMQVLADMERQGLLDALIEYGTNACFHVFIYDDGKPPK